MRELYDRLYDVAVEQARAPSRRGRCATRFNAEVAKLFGKWWFRKSGKRRKRGTTTSGDDDDAATTDELEEQEQKREHHRAAARAELDALREIMRVAWQCRRLLGRSEGGVERHGCTRRCWNSR